MFKSLSNLSLEVMKAMKNKNTSIIHCVERVGYKNFMMAFVKQQENIKIMPFELA
jgi:hypothetical protein